MSVSWMVYATCVAVLLAFAAILLERSLRNRAGATRGVWVSMLVGALVWPATVAVLSRHAAGGMLQLSETSSRPALPSRTALPVATAPLLSPPVTLPTVVPTSPGINVIADRVAMTTPLLVLAVLLVELIRTARVRRRWRPGLIDGVPVFVSVDFGPAIVGVLNPKIVIPAWALALPPEQRALMMAHESEHLASHDSRWLSAAFLAVVIAPWNIGLWWILSRFRLAMEVDCDHRVLLRGHDLEQYGNLLLGIGRHGTDRSLLAAGFAERRSMLRTRIDRMTGAAGATWGVRAWRVAIGTALAVAACSLGPARDVQHRTADTVAVRTDTANEKPAVSAVIPPSIRALLDRLPPPTTGTPSVATHFSRDTVDVGEPAELVTVTWFPRPLREGLRHLPVITRPLISGLSGASGQQLPIAGGTRTAGGIQYDLYVSWQTIPTLHGGRIEASPAVLTYERPASTIFAPEDRMTVRSLPTVLVVRPKN